MDLLNIARKFSTNPSACTDAEVAELAANFNDAHPQAARLFEIGNAHPTKWDGLLSAIAQAHYQRSNLEALSRNPFAEPGNLPHVAGDNPLAELSQGELAQMVFKA